MNTSLVTRVRGVGLAISVVIPAYNESARLPAFLRQLRGYLEREFAGGYEVIVVDDGSRDGTEDVLSAECGVRSAEWRQRGESEVILLRHERNLGKGAAVRTGLRHARGALVLVADADGATPIEEEADLRQAIERGADIAVGSRLVRSGKLRQRRILRRLLGGLASLFVRVTANCGVRDTQCGFKMMRREIAEVLAERTSLSGFAFDVELLRVARALDYRIDEVPVLWREVPGSKLRLVSAGARFLVDVLSVRLAVSSHDRFPSILRVPNAAAPGPDPPARPCGPPS